MSHRKRRQIPMTIQFQPEADWDWDGLLQLITGKWGLIMLIAIALISLAISLGGK